MKAPINYWSKEEDELIRKHYPVNGYKILVNILNGRSKESIQSRAFILGVKQIEYDEQYFSTIDTNNKAYWLGFIYSDGYVSESQSKFGIELSINDKNHLSKFLSQLKSNLIIRDREKLSFGENRLYSRVEIKNERIVRDLNNLGVHGDKTHNVKFPDERKVSDEHLPHFIRGVFDGDGSLSIYKNGNYYNFEISLTSASFEFIHSLKEVLNSGFNIESKVFEKDSNYFLRIYNKENCNKFIEKFYLTSSEENRLDRKI